MTEGSKWTPGKIFLLVVGILAGLGIVCCGGLWLVAGDKIKAGITFGTDSAAFVQKLQKDYGKTAVFGIEKNDHAEFILTIGAEGELTPERVTQIQDGAWKTFGEVFGKDGFLPVKHLAVGKPVGGAGKQRGAVIDWGRNVVSVEDLVKRTGVPAPPLVKFLPANIDANGTTIEVKATTEEGEKDQEDSGGGAGGK
jgi:hypothetical protein